MNNRGQIATLALGSAVASASVCVVLGVLFGTPPLPTIAIIVGVFVLTASVVYTYFTMGLVSADTQAEIARLKKVKRDYESTPLVPLAPSPEPYASHYTREIPRMTSAGMDTIKIQTAADKYDSLWREMCIRLCVWAEMKDGITVGQMVGRGETFPLATNRDWMSLTNVLQDSGYIAKQAASALTSRYSSFSQVALVISRGGQLPHPSEYPPSVREIPEKVMVMPEWESLENVG